MIDNNTAEVFPCRCDSNDCNYKKQWEDAGSPFKIPMKVAMGRTYLPLVSEWIKTRYCNRKGEQSKLIY